MKTPHPTPSRIDSLVDKYTTQQKRNNRTEERELKKYASSLRNVD
jgi:hypothetical protein